MTPAKAEPTIERIPPSVTKQLSAGKLDLLEERKVEEFKPFQLQLDEETLKLLSKFEIDPKQ